MWKRNKGDERRQELTVFKGPLFGKHLAIVRASWRGSHGKAAQVQEVVIKDRFDDVLNGAKFSEIVSGFLQSEADVSVYIECEPAELGLEDK